MAAINILRSRSHRIRDGYVFEGTGTFNSTDATGTLAIPSASKVRNVLLTWAGTPASDEIISSPAPNSTSGFIDLSSGAITITRTGGSKTSALAFNFRIEYQ